MELPGIIFITLLNAAAPFTPALFAAFESIVSRLVPVISPTASTTPDAAAIAAPHGPKLPIAERTPSLTALSSSGKVAPLIPPINEPALDKAFCQFLDIPILLPCAAKFSV